MNTLKLTICLLFSSLPAIAAEDVQLPGPDQEVEFKFSPRLGESARMEIATRTFGNMNMFGSTVSQKFSQLFEQEVAVKCIEVRPDQSSVYEMSLPNIAMRMNMGGFKFETDTRKDTPADSNIPGIDVVNRMFAAMTRIKCTITVSPQGEPVKVEGLSEGMKQVLDEVSDQLGFGMQQFFDQFRDYLADDMVAEQMRSSYRLFPDDGKARIGDKWTRQWQVKLPPFHTMTQGQGEYELLGFERFRGRPCAKIGVKSTLTTTPGQKPDPAALGNAPRNMFERMDFSMTSTGGNGIAYVDYTNGDLLHYRETQRMTMEISMQPDPNAEQEELKQGMGKITQKLTTSVRIELVEKDGQPLYDDDVEEEGTGQSPSPAAPAGVQD